MAKVTGYNCDVCQRFATNREGWLTVTPHASGVGADEFDICSADCIVKFGLERGGSVKGRRSSGSLAGQPRKRYDDEFKLEVGVYAAENNDHSAAQKYGVSVDSARRWREALT